MQAVAAALFAALGAAAAGASGLVQAYMVFAAPVAVSILMQVLSSAKQTPVSAVFAGVVAQVHSTPIAQPV